LLIERLAGVNGGLDILVVDDNSPDGTQEVVRGLQHKYSNLHLIVRPKKKGAGAAYKEAFKYVLARGYDIIIQMDADLSHDPRYIPQMIGMLEDYDLVIGSRYAKGSRIIGWNKQRFFLSKLANIFIRTLLGIKIADVTNGFKALKREVLEKIGCDNLTSQGYSLQIEINVLSYLSGFKIGECPTTYIGRRKDSSKMSFPIIIEAFSNTLRWAFYK
jgi:dolichol-phosphate mannosyltransferase